MTTVRRSRGSSAAAFVIGAAVFAAWGARASAHRLDEYLQAARIGIEPDRLQLELDLTPGVAVAGTVVADIDVDADKSISTAEARSYSERVLNAIALDVDGTPLRVELVDGAVPTIDAMRSGEGTARIRAVAAMPRLVEGLHHLRYRNAYRSDIAVYLANALVPARDRVTVTAQRRDVAQRDLIVDYVLRADPATRTRQRLQGLQGLQGLPIAIAGALVLAAGLWWRIRPPNTTSESTIRPAGCTRCSCALDRTPRSASTR